MPIKDLSPPGIEPVSLSYAKTFLRVDHDAEDDVISDLIISARMRAEHMIRASLISRRQLYSTETLSDAGLYINHGPVSAVHSVKTFNAAGDETVIPLDDLQIDLRAVPARLCLKPPARWRDYGACRAEVEIDAGYGAAANDVPMPLRQAVMLLLAQSYEFRGEGEAPPVPMMVDALLMPYRSLKL